MSLAIEKCIHISVRPAVPNDAAALAELSTQLGYPSSTQQVSCRLAQILGASDHVVFVAEITRPGAPAHVAGWVHGFVQRTIESDPSVEIGGLVVDQRQRGLGVGRVLMEHIERWAREAGCSTVTVRANVVRESAHTFYQRLGYDTVKSQRVFRKPLGAQEGGQRDK
jgi:GNAT superfamily N-acetyltransferase